MKKIIYLSMLPLFLMPYFLSAQWSSITMPEPRAWASAAANSTSVFVPGGITGVNQEASTMLVYNVQTETWTQNIPLQTARNNVSSTINGDLLFCAAGISFSNPGGAMIMDLVEIIDVNTFANVANATLSVPRVDLSAASVGTKVIFAGGYDRENIIGSPTTIYDVVDMYDVVTQTWTTAQLSEARGAMAHVVLGDKAYFAGGYKGNGEMSTRIDIYDATNDTWSTDELSEARAFLGNSAAAAANGKVYFAGGVRGNSSSSAIIDVYDTNNGEWSIEQLSSARAGIQATSTGNTLIFAGGGNTNYPAGDYTNTSSRVDVYDVATDQWTTHEMVDPRAYHAAASTGDQAFILGGLSISGGVPTLLTEVDVFTEPTCDDGIQNGDETGVDCGGSNCPACPTCDDGIQNGDETGVDCGGSDCPACPTCDDGIQNGEETGVDCGGPDCAPCCTLEITEVVATNTTCGLDNGSVEIITDGGVQLVEYSIDGTNFQEENFFDDLTADMYTIYVRDMNSCEVNGSFEVDFSLELEVDVFGFDPSCGMDNGQIQVQVEHAENPLFAIDNGPLQASNVFEDLSSGDYEIYVVDDNGCEVFEFTSLQESSGMRMMAAVTPSNCNASDGQVELTITGGTAPYQYALDNGPFGDSNIFSNLSANTYTVNVKDANDCTLDSMIVIENLGSLNAQAMVSGTNCGMDDGRIMVEVLSGSEPFEYSLDNITFTPSAIFENLPASTYTVYVKDASQCLVILDNLEIQASEQVAAEILKENPKCFESEDGKIEVTATAGIAPFEYAIDGGDFTSNNIFENLAASDYTVTIKDASNCEATIMVKILQPEKLEITINRASDRLTTQVTGGTPPYVYLWSDGSFFSELINPMEDSYTVVVTDANGCMEEAMISDVLSSTVNLFEENQLKVYPNPVFDSFTLEAVSTIVGENTIEVFDITGKQIFQQRMNNLDKVQINSSNWNRGTHILKVYNQEGISVTKVVIQ